MYTQLDYNSGFAHKLVTNISDWYFNTEEGQRCLVLNMDVYSVTLDETCEYYAIGILGVEMIKHQGVTFNSLLSATTDFFYFKVYADLKLLSWEYIRQFSLGCSWNNIYIISDEMKKEQVYEYNAKINFEIDISKYKFRTKDNTLMVSNAEYKNILMREPNLSIDSCAGNVKISILMPEMCEFYVSFIHWLNHLYHKDKGISLCESRFIGRDYMEEVNRISILNGYIEEDFLYLDDLLKKLDFDSYDKETLHFMKSQVMLKLYMYGDSRTEKYTKEEYENFEVIKKLRSYYKRLDLMLIGDCFKVEEGRSQDGKAV